MGRAAFFSSGWDNVHGIEAVQRGGSLMIEAHAQWRASGHYRRGEGGGTQVALRQLSCRQGQGQSQGAHRCTGA